MATTPVKSICKFLPSLIHSIVQRPGSFLRLLELLCGRLSRRTWPGTIISSSIGGGPLLSLRIICLQRSMNTSSTFARAESALRRGQLMAGLGTDLDVERMSHNTEHFPNFEILRMPSASLPLFRTRDPICYRR